MIIDLTQSVLLKEMCRIFAISNNSVIAERIDFTFSREALLGFATELLWLYDDINEQNKRIIATHPLQIDPSPNQAIGFYLTPNSPTLVLKVNFLDESEDDSIVQKNIKEIDIRKKNINQYYNVKNPSEESEIEYDEFICLETYELSRRNIVDIGIVNTKGDDITNCFSTVIIEINRKGIKALATMLLVWANNCNESKEYLIFQNGCTDSGYNLGIVLTQDSIPTKLKLDDLGTVYDYDERI